MGTIPELVGIIFPSGSGWMHGGGPLRGCPVPGKALPLATSGKHPSIIDTPPGSKGIIFPGTLG
jgi:hypothetical protein